MEDEGQYSFQLSSHSFKASMDDWVYSALFLFFWLITNKAQENGWYGKLPDCKRKVLLCDLDALVILSGVGRRRSKRLLKLRIKAEVVVQHVALCACPALTVSIFKVIFAYWGQWQNLWEPAWTLLQWVFRRRGSYVLKCISLCIKCACVYVGGVIVQCQPCKHFTMTWKIDAISGAHVMGPASLPWQQKSPE